MRTHFLFIVVAPLLLAIPIRAATEAQRREHLEWMLKDLPDAPEWRKWQLKTGALPPDFDRLRSANYLPDPTSFAAGGR